MKKIFSFLCLIVAVTAMTSCSSAKEEKGITELEEQIKEMLCWIIFSSAKVCVLI